MSCTRAYIPGPYIANPLGPRMIQPIPRNANANALPEEPNFVQSYPKYWKSKADSKFGALVRIIEFEYNIGDTITITPRITSGFDEGEMTGLFTILSDEYELTYENKNPQIREYIEEVSYESNRPVRQAQQIHNPARTDVIVGPDGQHSTVHHPASYSTVYNNLQEKQSQVINRSQIYNTATYRLEHEDVKSIQKSKSLQFKIQLQNCEITIRPSKEQIRVLQRMIQKHY